MDDIQIPTPTFRPTINGPKVYELLIREFARKKDSQCTRCIAPLPFWGPSPGSQAGYWYMQSPSACAYRCGHLLSEIWAKLTTEYTIAPPEKERVRWKHGVRATASSE